MCEVDDNDDEEENLVEITLPFQQMTNEVSKAK
jgi:hypothetical protein